MEHKVKNIAFITIGVLVILCAISLRTDAKWWAFQGSQGGGYSWALWNEAEESGLSNDQVEVNDTFCAFFENTTASGNETGVGIGTGANLVLTQGGSVSGATGSPPRRYMTTNDYFDFTNGLASFAKSASKKWTIVQKWSDVSTRGMYCDVYSAANYIRLYYSGNKLYLQDASGNATSADDTPTTGTLYIAAWCDGTKTRAGFTTTRPTKLSDFTSGTSVVLAGAAIDYSAVTFTSASIGIYSNDHTTGPVTANAYYVVFSKACLIDNSL